MSEQDTSEAAQDARKESMAAQLKEAGVERVSQLSPLWGRDIVFDGITGSIIQVHATEDRFSAELEDGRRPWGTTSAIVEGEPLTYTSPDGE